MSLDALLSAARILQSQPGYTMPLVRLHAQLVRELGAHAGSYGQIYQALKKRTDSFAILDAPRVLGTDDWPGGVREAYDAALDGAGFGSCVRVMLTEMPLTDDRSNLLAALGLTLAHLATSTAGDCALAGYLERATHEAAEIVRIMQGDAVNRPTTPLPDPPPAE
jgi:hypothetical protein